MAGPDDTDGYLFDDEALERCLADGTPESHVLIQECQENLLFLTSASKEMFLSVYPDEKDKISTFAIIRKKVADIQIAAAFSDQLQNYPDIDSKQVEDKISLLAIAARANKTVVTGEMVSPTTRIKVLAEQTGVRCINVDEFLAEMAG